MSDWEAAKRAVAKAHPPGRVLCRQRDFRGRRDWCGRRLPCWICALKREDWKSLAACFAVMFLLGWAFYSLWGAVVIGAGWTIAYAVILSSKARAGMRDE